MKIAAQLYRIMTEHVESEYPCEACGLLVGFGQADGRIHTVHPTRNILDELHEQDPQAFPRTRKTGYVVDPAQQFQITRTAEEAGDVVRGIYHSHIDVGAYFSDEDKAQALPFGQPAFPQAIYIVFDVKLGSCKGSKAFIWDETDQNFVETPLEIEDEHAG